MSNAEERPSARATPKDEQDAFEATRMSFGDHLDELRNSLIRALLGIMVTTLLGLYFGTSIVAIICRPLLIVQHENGLQPNLQVLAPTAGFITYLKIAFLSGLIVAMPWVLYQLWLFVASGLYPRERRFVRFLILPSTGLFVAGVLFLYFIVLPIVLNFFIKFNERFSMPDLSAAGFQSWLLPEEEPPEPVVTEALVKVPLLREDPVDPQPGEMWVNTTRSRLMIQTSEGLWSAAMEQRPSSTAMQSQFAIDFYMSFVLMLALAFGIAFETPIVVFFLAWSGIVPTAAMARARRYVILGTVITAAVMTPPDVISQILLALPMYLLFELGIAVARFTERKKGEAADGR